MSATPNVYESNVPIDLTGQVALVTGGGLGRVFALALAAVGAAVVVAAASEVYYTMGGGE